MHGAGNALDRALASLLAGTGAWAVRLVDGSGVVVAALPTAGAGIDDPATVARLVGEAVAPGRGAPGRGAPGRGCPNRGGPDDVVVTTAGALHVLRPTAVPGAFLHLTAAPDADRPRVRRMLADPALHLLIGSALAPARVPWNVARPLGPVPDRQALAAGVGTRDADRVPRNVARPVPGRPRAVVDGVPRTAALQPVVPLPRSAGPAPQAPAAEPRSRVPAPRLPGRVAELPALAGLVPGRGRTGHGALAVQALAGEVRAGEARAGQARAVGELPRRSPSGTLARPALAHSVLALAPTPGSARTGLPDRAWAGDLDTMRRLLVGLRRLA